MAKKKISDLLETLGPATVSLLKETFTDRSLEEWMFSKRESLNDQTPADIIKNGQTRLVRDLCWRLYAIEGDVLKNEAPTPTSKKKKAAS